MINPMVSEAFETVYLWYLTKNSVIQLIIAPDVNVNSTPPARTAMNGFNAKSEAILLYLKFIFPLSFGEEVRG